MKHRPEFVWPALAGLVAAAVLGWVIFTVDGAVEKTGQLERSDRDKTAAIAALSAQVERLCRNRPECEPVVDTSDPDDPELQEIEQQDPEIQDPEIQQPEPDNKDPNDPDPDDPEHQNPEIQDPEADDPETQDSEFDDPEQQEPEIQDPENQDPEIDDPDPDDPDPNDEMADFTFEWMGSTWTCSDPDNDRHWTCTAAPQDGGGPQ